MINHLVVTGVGPEMKAKLQDVICPQGYTMSEAIKILIQRVIDGKITFPRKTGLKNEKED